MYGDLDLDRFALLRQTFSVAGPRDDERPGIYEWAAAIGVNRGYFAAIRATSVHLQSAIETAAAFRGLDPVKLSRWLHGYKDAGVEAALAAELRKMHCIGEGPHLRSGVSRLAEGWFDVKVDKQLLILPLRLCKACARAKNRKGTPSWIWQQRLQTDAHRLSPKVRGAIAQIQAAGHVPTVRGIAEAAGLPCPKVRAELIRAGLKKPRADRMRTPQVLNKRTRGLRAPLARPAPRGLASSPDTGRARDFSRGGFLRVGLPRAAVLRGARAQGEGVGA